EVPCQWELLSVPGPVGALWPVNSCRGEGQQPLKMAVLLPGSFDPTRPKATGLPTYSPKKP
ncbi:hypothetical protein KUCAC02_026430, partial [Chaenocephalus aceratus]